MNRTEEIAMEICETVRVNPYTIDERITPTKLATYLASLEARVEALENLKPLGTDSIGRKMYVEKEAPKEPASWIERFDENCRGYFFANGKDAYDGYDDEKIKAFIAEEKKRSVIEGIEMVEGVVHGVLRDSRTVEEVYTIGKREDIARTQAFVDITLKLSALKKEVIDGNPNT